MEQQVEFNDQQRAAISLIRSDLQFVFTIVQNAKNINSNFIVMMLPYLGTVVDGAEDWLKAYNNAQKQKLTVPLFSPEEQQYYEEMRSSIKFWDSSYDEIYSRLKEEYTRSDVYFSSLCKPIAKLLHLYDIYGVDTANGKFCGNTILCSYYSPQYHLGCDNGEQIKKYMEIAGRYIAIFSAVLPYNIDNTIIYSTDDFGGFKKSPFGRKFNDKHLLFSLLCQINYLLICLNNYILDECPTKLRFLYLHYYYVARIIPEINKAAGTSFTIRDDLISVPFRNAMAHYKVGVALRPTEIIWDDLFFGMTQKFFHCEYGLLKDEIVQSLSALANQLEEHLKI